MAVERKDLFGDGKVYCDYYPHKRVELRVAGFKIVVHKPYTVPYYNNRVYKGPKIYMSTNGTVEMYPFEYDLMKKAVDAGIAILNGEGYNLITNESFGDETLVNLDDIPNLDKRSGNAVKVNTIRYDNQNCGSIITMTNGKKSVYVGHGYIYRLSFGETRQLNRQKSYEIYLDFADSVSVSMVTNGVLEVMNHGEYSIMPDTLVGKRKAIKIEDKIGGRRIQELVVHNKNSKPDVFKIVLL